MPLVLYQMASSSQSYFALSIPRKKVVQIVTQKGTREHFATRCKANNKVLQTHNRAITYQKTIWTHDFIESLETKFSDMEKLKKLEEKVGTMLIEYENGGSNTLQLLELVDDIERLGLGYRFQTDIMRILAKVASTIEIKEHEEDEDSVHAAALKFRLLRDHGYGVSQDFLERFKDSHGGLRGCLQTYVKAMVSIYEASYLALESELDLHEARLFASENLLKMHGHALDVPLYRMVERLQARWHIEAYGNRKDANKLLLELAILDFNMVQSANTRDLQQVSKWWGTIDLTNKLSFIRDRIMECFFWGVGMVFQPQYYSSRILLTKVCALITAFDDIYDICESLDDLHILTDAVKRWEINTVKDAPAHLQLGFLALYNTINEMGYDNLTRRGNNIIPTLAKVWGELCEAFFVEAKWTQINYMPTLDAYLDNAWVSASGMVILTHGYLSMNQNVKTDSIDQSLEKCHDLFKWSSMIFRLYNDLVISSEEIERGESPNAISCYMHENGVSEEVAREYTNTLLDKAWMKMIEARVACSEDVAYPVIDMAINLARVSHSMYQYGDGHGAPDARANELVSSVIIEPIANKAKEH